MYRGSCFSSSLVYIIPDFPAGANFCRIFYQFILYHIHQQRKRVHCGKSVLCFAYLYLIRFFVQKKTALPSYLPFLLDKWSRSATIPTIAVYARMIMALLIKNHLFIQTTAIKIATIAATIINAAIFFKRFFMFFPLFV